MVPNDILSTALHNQGLYGYGPSPAYNPWNLSTGATQFFGPQVGQNLQGADTLLQFAAPFLMPMLQQYGSSPGQLFGTQNVYDRMRAYQRMQGMMAVNSAAQDRTTRETSQFLDGMTMLMHGQPITVAQRQQNLRMANMVGGPLNMVGGMLPTAVVDAFSGITGSQARMGQNIFRAGNVVLDPVTGMRGLSADTSAALSAGIFSRLYGNTSAIAEMRGTGAGALGELFDEMTRRGMMGGQLSDRERMLAVSQDLTTSDLQRAAKTIADREGISLDQAERRVRRQFDMVGSDPSLTPERLSQTTEGQELLRASDATRYSNTLKSFNKAVTAMREIFGDAGRPNAPMSELINSLDALTQGGLATMSDADLAGTVRKTYNLARMGNISLEAVHGLTAQVGAAADQFGLDRSLAVQAVQGSLAFGAGAQSALGLNQRVFGAMDREKLTLLDAQLRTSAAASPQAQWLAAVARISDSVGGLPPELEEVAEAIRTGQTRTASGKSLYDYKYADIFNQLVAGGMPAGMVQNVMHDARGNQEWIHKYDIGGIVRNLQPEEMRENMARAFNFLASTNDPALANNGVSKALGENLANTLSGMSVNDVVNRDKRVEAIRGMLQNNMRAELPQLMKAYGAADIDDLAKRITMQADTQVQAITPQAYGSAVNMYRLMSKEGQQEAARMQEQATVDAQVQEALSGLGSGNVISRLVTAVKGANENTKIEDLLPTILGAATPEAMQTALDKSDPTGQSSKLYGGMQSLLSEIAVLRKDKSPAGRARLQERIATLSAYVQGGDTAKSLLAKRQQEFDAMDAAGTLTADERLRREEELSLLGIAGDSSTSGIAAALVQAGYGDAANIGGDVGAATHRKKLFDMAKKYNLTTSTGLGDNADTMTAEQQIELHDQLLNMAQGGQLSEDEAKYFEDLQNEQEAAQGGVAATAPTIKIPDKIVLSGKVQLIGNELVFDEETQAAFDTEHTPV